MENIKKVTRVWLILLCNVIFLPNWWKLAIIGQICHFLIFHFHKCEKLMISLWYKKPRRLSSTSRTKENTTCLKMYQLTIFHIISLCNGDTKFWCPCYIVNPRWKIAVSLAIKLYLQIEKHILEGYHYTNTTNNKSHQT